MIIKRSLALRLACLVIISVMAWQLAAAAPWTTAEKEQMYNAAILNLETYLEGSSSASSLVGIEAVFSQLGRYEQSQPLMYYTRLLQKLEADEYDYDVTIQLEMLENNTTFQEYLNDTLKGSAISSVEKLKTYIEGRQKEHQGHTEAALASYRECMDYFDTTDRYLALKSAGDETRYTTALYLTQLGDYAGAYFAFAQTNGYKDSNERRQAIISLLGYVPASETDNPEPVTELKAECKAAEATLTWNKPKHTSAFQAAFRKKGTEQWYTADCTASTYTFTNLTPDTEYEFAVTAWAGKVEVGTRFVQARTKSLGIELDGKNFPDAVFRAYISEKCDEDHDGFLSDRERNNVGFIQCDSMGISDLTGIEYFPKLYYLSCYGNALTSLDVSQNTALTELHCSGNRLTDLDVSKNIALDQLFCSYNKLTGLDVSKNTVLSALSCTENNISKLDISNNKALVALYCDDNNLIKLDVRNNVFLQLIYCAGNQLSSLDVSKNTLLNSLWCRKNTLKSLDVQKNTALKRLNCDENQLTSLDVSKNTALSYLSCDENKLTNLDLSKNTALTELHCSFNKLTSLDLSKNAALVTVWCRMNNLASLNASKCVVLTELVCDNNKLTSLDVSKNAALTKLQCGVNNLTSLNLTNNKKLTTLYTDYGIKIQK